MASPTTTRWNLYLPTSLTNDVDATLVSTFRGGVPYGARAELVSRLLVQYLDRLDGREPSEQPDALQDLDPAI